MKLQTRFGNIKSKLMIAGTSLLAAGAARADVLDDAVTEVTGYAVPVGLAATAILAVALVFAGVKLGKRVLGKA